MSRQARKLNQGPAASAQRHPTNDQSLQIETRSIESLKLDRHNPRKHNARNLNQIERSLKDYGAARSIVIDENDEILAGNGLVEAARKTGIKNVKIVEASGEEVIAVRRSGLSDKQKTEYKIADNRSSELAEWDIDVLKDSGFDTNKFWNEKELSNLFMDDFSLPQEELLIDPSANLLKKWKIKSGDIFSIGNHRFMCGDSTDPSTVAKLFASAKPETLIYDPPWDSKLPKFDSEMESILAFCDGRRCKDVIIRFGPPTWVFVWRCGGTWYNLNRPLQGMKLCLWYGDLKLYKQKGAFYGEQKVKAPKRVENARGKFIFIPDQRGKMLSDLYSESLGKLHSQPLSHHHEKPLDWIRLLMANCSAGLIYDPFVGSGTTIIAAESLGRTCYGIEIDPGQCAICLERAEHAGLKPVLLKKSAVIGDTACHQEMGQSQI